MGLFDFLKKKELTEIQELKTQLERYKSISDIEAEVTNQMNSLELMVSSKTSEVRTAEDNLNALNSNYKTALETYTKLRKEVGVFESKLDLIEFGVYEPVYDFEKSDEYRTEQNRIVEKQKAMVGADTAAICTTQWTVEGS